MCGWFGLRRKTIQSIIHLWELCFKIQIFLWKLILSAVYASCFCRHYKAYAEGSAAQTSFIYLRQPALFNMLDSSGNGLPIQREQRHYRMIMWPERIQQINIMVKYQEENLEHGFMVCKFFCSFAYQRITLDAWKTFKRHYYSWKIPPKMICANFILFCLLQIFSTGHCLENFTLFVNTKNNTWQI